MLCKHLDAERSKEATQRESVREGKSSRSMFVHSRDAAISWSKQAVITQTNTHRTHTHTHLSKFFLLQKEVIFLNCSSWEGKGNFVLVPGLFFIIFLFNQWNQVSFFSRLLLLSIFSICKKRSGTRGWSEASRRASALLCSGWCELVWQQTLSACS